MLHKIKYNIKLNEYANYCSNVSLIIILYPTVNMIIVTINNILLDS